MFGSEALGMAGLNPVEEQAPVALLLVPAGLTDGQLGLGTVCLEGSPLLLQVEVAEEPEVPEAHDALGRANLVLVAAEHLLDVSKGAGSIS